jgi:hypothetical protein
MTDTGSTALAESSAYDFVQATLGARDATDSLPLRRYKLKVTSSDVGMVALFI